MSSKRLQSICKLSRSSEPAQRTPHPTLSIPKMLLNSPNLHLLRFLHLPLAPPPPLPLHPNKPFLLNAPASLSSLRATSQPQPTIASDQESQVETDGPIELPPSSSYSNTIFAVDDNPSPLQVATSVLLTGAISVFLFRSLRRRAKRAKDLRLRSSGVKNAKDIREEALDSLKAMGVASVEVPKGPPSPVQAALGAIAAGVISLILYKFATTVEASLNRQAISDNFSVRQITITIRTIVNGLCYLATFVFGINSVGLFLYSIQLAINSFMDSPSDDSLASKKNDDQPNATSDYVKSSTDNSDSSNDDKQQSSDDS